MTSTSQVSHATVRSNGSAAKARCSIRSRSASGHRNAAQAATATAGISQLKTVTVSVPTLELTFRSRRSPPRPCSRVPANVPMSDAPAAGKK